MQRTSTMRTLFGTVRIQHGYSRQALKNKEGTMPTQPESNPAFPEGEGGEQMLTRMNSGAHEQLAQWGLSFIDLRYKMFGLDVGCDVWFYSS